MKTRHVFMLLMLLLAASTGFANDVAATTVANSTEKEAYYLFNSETKTLTCYFDTNKSARRGRCLITSYRTTTVTNGRLSGM